MKIKTTLNKIYTYKFLDDLILMYPFYSVYMTAKGLSVFQISSLFVLWSLVSLLTNIPTGVFADKYSRKKLLALGQVFKAVSFVPWIIYPHYLGFAIAFILWGIGSALTSGTFEALVYDELKVNNKEQDYVKVIGRAYSFSLIGNLTATLLAGLAILLGFGFIFAASIIVIVLSSIVILTLPETPRFEQVSDQRYLSMLKTGIKRATHNKTIFAIILLAGFIGATYGSLEEYVPLFVYDTGLSLSFVAWAVGATVAAAAFGSFIAHRYEKMSTGNFMIVLISAGFMMFGAGLLGNNLAVLLLVGYTFIIRMLKQIYDGKLQHSITSELRATITSVASFVLELLAILTYLTYGLIADRYNNFIAFAVFGSLTVFVGLIYLVISPRLVSRHEINKK